MTSSFPPFSYPPLGGVVLLLLAAVCFPNVRAHSQHDGEHHAGLRHHHAEGCGHDEFKNLPGYGVNAPVIHANYPVNTSHRDASTGHRGFTTTAVTYGSIRITLFFDQGDCTGGTTTCGHCTAVGQTVTTFESTTATTVCAADDVLTDAKKSYIMDTLMAGAVAFYSTAISVIPVSGNLVVTGGSTCGTGPGTPVPSAHRSTGVANTDLILYVTAVPKQDRTSAVVAWATACRVDAAGRTLVGQVNFIPAKLTNADSPIATSTDSDTKVAIHEICHALGYSAPFYGSYGYLDTDGATWVSGGTTTAYSTSLSKSVTYINSPRVLREVRNHFGCQTLLGAEIEDQGGSGTSGTHWEKRIFYQSTMAGIVSSVTPFHDRFMLAFLEDTGHYVADYTVADPRLQWGKGKGCTFATALCNTISTTKASSSLEFCFDSSQSNSYCTYDRLGRGYCDVSQFSSVPSANQYFTNTALGASVYLADYCPAVLPYSNQICIEPTIVDKNNIFGNTYSANSRCFDSNLISVDYSSSSSSTQTRCFPVICLVGRLILKIGGQQVLCPSGGAAGSADTSAISNSYQGSITCPAASVFGCTTSSSGTLSSSFTATPSPPTTTASTPGSNAPGATGAGSGSGPTTTTTAAPTATPLIEGGLLPFTTPAAPTASCADRVPCASAAFSLLPRCRKVAAAVQKCFARDCDTQMENFFAAIGVTPNCSTSVTKNSFAASCEEGMAGVYDLCQLADANAVRVLSITLGATVVALFVYLL